MGKGANKHGRRQTKPTPRSARPIWLYFIFHSPTVVCFVLFSLVGEDIPAVAIARLHREHSGSGSVAWSRWCVQIHVHLTEPYKNTGEYGRRCSLALPANRPTQPQRQPCHLLPLKARPHVTWWLQQQAWISTLTMSCCAPGRNQQWQPHWSAECDLCSSQAPHTHTPVPYVLPGHDPVPYFLDEFPQLGR